MSAHDRLYHDIREQTDILGETTRERQFSDCEALHLLRIPFCWTELYENSFWDFINPLVIKVYSFLGKIHTALGLG